MSADVINKFEPITKTANCPNGILLWIAFALVIAGTVFGIMMARPNWLAKSRTYPGMSSPWRRCA
jgi:hypothetical protein